MQRTCGTGAQARPVWLAGCEDTDEHSGRDLKPVEAGWERGGACTSERAMASARR